VEEIQDSLQKVTLKEIAQTPFAWSLYTITLVLISVIWMQRTDRNKEKDGCDAKIATLEEAIKDERKEKDEVFKAYLVERGVNQQIQKVVDSTAIDNFKSKQR
jgi:hypothetical protein